MYAKGKKTISTHSIRLYVKFSRLYVIFIQFTHSTTKLQRYRLIKNRKKNKKFKIEKKQTNKENSQYIFISDNNNNNVLA